MGQTQRVTGRATSIRVKPIAGMELPNATCVNYRGTDVVQFNEKRIVLNTGGWKTVTTKLRMNQTSNQFALGYAVGQRNFEWFVTYKEKEIPFTSDSVTLDREGK